MKITYHKNPLYTTVELAEHEKKELWYKIKIEELQNLLFEAHFHFKEGQFQDMKRVQESLNPDYYLDEEKPEQKSKLDERCDELLNYYLDELKSFHSGDCTCVPASCLKCVAERTLGIDTIPGLKKHSSYKIDGAFGKNNEKTIDEAIESLANYTPVKGESWNQFSQEEFDKHVPRWTAEAKNAHDWLVHYKNTYFQPQEK